MSRLIALSNRTAHDRASRAGGLAVALWDALRDSGGVWFGWSGDLIDEASKTLKTQVDEGVEFVLSDLTHEEYEGYYINYANRVIWPVFHYRVDLASFDSDAFKIYADVNQRFADIIVNRLNPDDIVWAHDYHFLLLADGLRRNGWRGPVGFFLHIPFPPRDLFRALPEHQWIARAMAAFDVVGFQTETDRANFIRYLTEDCGGEDLGDGRVRVFGCTPIIKTYPIGIDPEAFLEARESDVAKNAAARIGQFLGKREFVLGVDRMDYSKGIPERFEAVGRLLQEYPDTIGRVSFTQIAPPSRSKVEEYQELRVELDRLAGQINGDYGDLDWIPLRYLARSYDREELAGLFKIAKVGLVTPLRDGMNLVAKEFVMAQEPEDPGVLILSEFAGAAEQMKNALLVNPHDVGAVAEAIYQSLTMPLDERQERWKTLHEIVRSADIEAWRKGFLGDLRKCSDRKGS
ncbi:MAG: trehalose-6-phosphate synthase [Pseudomonadota bacterium]